MAALVSYRLRHFDLFSKTTSYEDTRLARNVPCGKFSAWACLDSEEEVKNVKSL
jgi:hypothetical protein